MTHCLRVTALVVAFATPLFAQAQPPAQPPAPKPAAPPATPPAAPRTTPRATATSAAGSALAVQVTDKSGNGIGDVAVTATGPVERTGRTAADGTVSFRSMRVGTYRLRFEHDKFITLERELMVGTRANEVSIALNPAPQKPVVAPPPPAAPAPVQPPPRSSNRAVDPRTLSIPDFFEKNSIGSEPQKTSLLGCTDGGTARLLQVKDPMNNQVNADADQVLYIVGGSGVFRVRDQDYKAEGGYFVLIPRGATYSARRVGRNPIVALAVTMGAPCTETGPLAK